MEIIKHTDPWLHYTVENFFTYEENKELYDYCLSKLPIEPYNDLSLFFEHGELQNNVGVTTLTPSWIYQKINSQLHEISNYLDMTSENFNWSFGYSVTGDLPDKPLLPHNDDYEELKQYGAGKIKCLVYLGLNDVDYTDWGTKLYTKECDYSSLAKEVEFVPGTAFIFCPAHDTYHGTDFVNGLNGYRFLLGAEYA